MGDFSGFTNLEYMVYVELESDERGDMTRGQVKRPGREGVLTIYAGFVMMHQKPQWLK